jgi:acyl carrier protein
MESTSVETDRSARIRQIREVAAGTFEVGPEQVEAAESFTDDLGADSLLAVEFLVALERRFGIALELSELTPLMANLDSAYEAIAAIAGWPADPAGDDNREGA